MMRKVQCESCRAYLSSGNPYYYRQDGIKLCTPCRQAAWTSAGWPSTVLHLPKRMKEQPAVVSKQRHDKVAKALPIRKVCECEHPIPMGDEDEADSCFKCNKRIPVRAAA